MVEAGVALELHLIDVELGTAEGFYLAFRWFFQRYLAHIITERRIKTLALKSLPEELKAWSAPLPKEQWAKPSEALQRLNQQLTRAYERGLKFTQMGPVSEWQAGREEKQQQKRGKGRFRA
mgnify:CR=1 FL=1